VFSHKNFFVSFVSFVVKEIEYQQQSAGMNVQRIRAYVDIL